MQIGWKCQNHETRYMQKCVHIQYLIQFSKVKVLKEWRNSIIPWTLEMFQYEYEYAKSSHFWICHSKLISGHEVTLDHRSGAGDQKPGKLQGVSSPQGEVHHER